MQVVVKALDHLTRQITVTLPAEIVSRKIETRLRDAMRHARIDGFRPGKTPRSVIEKKFGKSIEFETLETLARENLPQVLQQEALTIATQPKLTLNDYKKDQDFTFVLEFETFPKIALQPFQDLIIEQPQAEITSEDVEQTLTGMRQQQQQWVVVTRAAQTHDKVEFDFLGKLNGEPFAGGKAENFSLVLSSGQMIPGFESSLVGHNVGEEFTIDVTFPETYHSKDLAGQATQFDIKIHKIEEAKLPDLDDEFAQKFGLADGTIATLREEVMKTLTQQRDKALRRLLKQDVMEKLRLAYHEIPLPTAIIQTEAASLRQQMEENLKKMKNRSGAIELQDEMFIERAKDRTLLGLLLEEIIKHYQLQPDPLKVREIIEEIAEKFDDDKARQVIEWHYQNKELLTQVEGLALEEKVVDLIIKDATLVEKTVLLKELLTPQGAQ